MANDGSPNSTSIGLSVRHFSFRVGVDILFPGFGSLNIYGCILYLLPTPLCVFFRNRSASRQPVFNLNLNHLMTVPQSLWLKVKECFSYLQIN